MGEPKTRTSSRFRFHTDFPSQLRDDTLADRQSESRTGNKTVEFYKSGEDSFLFFRLYPHSRILNGEFYFVSVYLVVDGDASFGSEFNALVTKFSNT